MSYKTILTILQNLEDCDRVLDTALHLNRQLGSHLIGLHAESGVSVSYAAPIEIPDVTAFKLDQHDVEERMDDISKRFSAKCARENISWEWRPIRSLSGDSALSALSSARCSDLVIVGQQPPEHHTTNGDIETLLLESGRPVLFVPYITDAPRTISHAVVAWNGSREAARATFDAMPFLMAAQSVEILCVDPEDNVEQSKAVAGAEIAATLTRHGVKVTARTEVTDGLPTAAAIENRMSDTGADLLVMGALGRKKLTEYFFGGVTRTILNSMPSLTFMSR